MKLDETLNYLFALTTKGIKLGLDRMHEFLDTLGNPQQGFRSIHIAGTNGKGSVAHMVYAVLKAAGTSIGLYTSPHIRRFNERVIVNGAQMPNRFITDFVNRHRQAFEKLNLTFFEITTAMAFEFMKDQQVETAVIETGLGGRLDATNVLIPSVCAITDISMDHENYLGNTLTQIAKEKAGIIKEGVPLVIGIQNQEARSAVLENAHTCLDVFETFSYDVVDENAESTTLNIKTDSFTLDRLWLPLAGAHQIHNALITLGIVQHLDMNIPGFVMHKGFTKVQVPARLELRSGEPDVLFDVAHNEKSIKALHTYLEKFFDSRKIVIVFGAMADKHYDAMVKILLTEGREFIFTRPDTERAAGPKIIQLRTKTGTAIPDVLKAFDTAKRRAGKNGLVVVTGSFYTVGEVYG